MTQIAIAAVPYVDTIEPIMAPGLLKAVLAEKNIDSTAIDLNIDIVNYVTKHTHSDKLLDFFYSQIIHPEVVGDIHYLINYCSNKILSTNSPIVALSLLTYSCQIFTRWLCADLKQKSSTIKIVIGGTGIKNFVADNNTAFVYQLKDLNLIDDFIYGDGEQSLVEYTKGNTDYPGINQFNWIPVPDLNALPMPDYSDYDFSSYGKILIPVCDSRGCVRNCEFCDIIEHWQKFQFRTAENIFNEMIEQYKKYNITYFSFRSSLVNGNLKEFRKLVKLIAEFNFTLEEKDKLGWEGYYIIRNFKAHPPELWADIKDSNGKLVIGVESVVTHIRHGMGKNFDNEDIDYHLEMAKQYKVPLVLLMIVAYPTETLADFEFTKQWFRERSQYADSVDLVNLAFAGILPGTELDRRSDDYGIKKGKFPSIWINQNLNITPSDRKNYLRELNRVCRQAGFNAITNEQTLEHTTDEI